MTLKEISIRNLIRRKGKAAFVLTGLVIGVTTVVAIISFVEAMTSDINHKLEKYGANILIVPKTENLSLSYGNRPNMLCRGQHHIFSVCWQRIIY